VRKFFLALAIIGLLSSQAYAQITLPTEHIRINAKAGEVDANQVRDAITLYQQGISYLNHQDMHSAEKYLKQAVAKAEPMKQALGDSLLPPLYAHTGYVVLHLGKAEEAKSYLAKAQACNSNAQPVQFLASQIAQLDGSPDYIRYHSSKIIHWNDQCKEIYIYIAPGTPENTDLIRQAFLTWQQAINNQFVFVFVNHQSYSDVQVNWTNAQKLETAKSVKELSIRNVMIDIFYPLN
jgi:tetratricopeptide (TPR) repeat protein